MTPMPKKGKVFVQDKTQLLALADVITSGKERDTRQKIDRTKASASYHHHHTPTAGSSRQNQTQNQKKTQSENRSQNSSNSKRKRNNAGSSLIRHGAQGNAGSPASDKLQAAKKLVAARKARQKRAKARARKAAIVGEGRSLLSALQSQPGPDRSGASRAGPGSGSDTLPSAKRKRVSFA